LPKRGPHIPARGGAGGAGGMAEQRREVSAINAADMLYTVPPR